MHVKIYGSTCPQTKLFYGYFKNLFSEYEIDADFESITNPKLIRKAGLKIDCAFSHCIGCNTAHAGANEKQKYVPAIAVDDKIIYHSFYLKLKDEEKIKAIMQSLKENNTNQ